ncbi:MOT14-like protein [Mya arenaria]|uniref:MOT14-like protein n=1 Tax=Mya arenaria TaxID=6604 RepID=A0ABY7FSD6_MYAAR|nr:MOT14-like protein [Mya arenaria]
MIGKYEQVDSNIQNEKDSCYKLADLISTSEETCECQAELVVKKGDPEDDCFEDLDTGWAWMVLIASFLTFCLVGAAIYAVGITHAVLLDKYGASVAVTSWAGALHSALNTLGAPLSSLLIDRFSCRVTLVLSGVCYTVGFLATAYAPNIYIAIFTCGILAGTGGALGYTASMVVVGFNFRSKRNLALGISNAGIGFGLFALAPVMQKAREEYGSTGYFLIMAVIYGLLVGSPYVVAMPVSLMFIEMQHLAVSLGLQFSFGGIGAIVGPVIAGILVDHFGNYEMSFIVAGVCVLVSGIVGILSVRCKRAFKQSIEVNVDDPKT